MSEENRKTRFAWASIAGADAEPVELINIEGREGIYTLGCADPFWLDDLSAGIVVYGGNALERPAHPETKEQRGLRESIYQAKKAAEKASYEWHRHTSRHGPDCAAAGCIYTGTHGWRGPR